MKKQHFSLVELLVVIGIIVLLAGLMIPAVMSSKTKGQITEAKADMAAIKMALTAVERDYKTIFRPNSSGDYVFYELTSSSGNSRTVRTSIPGLPSGTNQLVLGGSGDRFNGVSVNDMTDGYYGMIAELTVPRDVNAGNKNFNTRNIKYLDPRPDYVRGDNTTMWQDPWGNPYVVMIDSDFDDRIFIPYNASQVLTAPAYLNGSHLVLRGKVLIYSLGPNGVDDGSFNADNGGVSTADDVRGWEK